MKQSEESMLHNQGERGDTVKGHKSPSSCSRVHNLGFLLEII